MAPQVYLGRCLSREERGGYDCQLVDPPPAHIQTECSVCLQILRQPCIVSCCGHKFCRECIEAVVETSKDCPLCNGHDFSFMAEHSLSRTLLDLVVYCSAQSDGCTWTGRLKDIEAHLNRSYSVEDQLCGCQFFEVTCVHPGCVKIMQRRYAAAHQTSECRKRPHTCQYCLAYTFTYSEVTENHYCVCEKFPVHCPNGCAMFPIEQNRVEKHLRDECSLAVVACPFLYAGCEASLPREEMLDHARDMSTHFPMLADVNRRLVYENTQLQSRVTKLEREKEEKERFMMSRIFQLSSACCASHHFIRHTELQHNDGGPFVMDTTIGPFIMDTTITSDIVSKTMEMEMRSMYFAVLPYEFKMDNFLNYIKGGPTEYSPIFYTHSFGYRFRIRVIRTEYSKLLSLEAFTSVYVEILSGPFDNTLNWPFKGSITISVVNQLDDCNHYEATVCFCDETYYEGKVRKRPEKGSPVSLGLRRFVYHKDLRNRHTKDGRQTHYLHNGILHFRITKIEVSKAKFENSLC